MQTPEPLSYEPAGKAPRRPVLPIVALCSGSCALALYLVDQFVCHFSLPTSSARMYGPKVMADMVGGIGAQIFGYVAITTSIIAYLRHGSMISKLSVIIAIAFWSLIVAFGFPDLH